MKPPKPDSLPQAPDEQQVLDFLARNPDFLMRHPALLAMLMPPRQGLGENVADFQHFQIKSLQASMRNLSVKHQELVEFCRHTLSVQGSVHQAVLKLVRAGDLSQLLEAVTLDMAALFDVDAVRLALESTTRAQYETYYPEQNYSGIVFIDEGVVEEVLEQHKKVLLVADVRATPVPGFAQIFADCSGLIHSCALLRLHLPRIRKHALLAFGVRHAGRFQPGQAIELLNFLAAIVAHRLDAYLDAECV